MWWLLAAVAIGAIVFLFVLPGRTLINQGHAMSQTQAKIAQLNQENAALATKAKQLQNDSEVAQIAHSQYGLVKPGQKAYAVIPPATSTTTVPGKRGSSASPSGSPSGSTNGSATTAASTTTTVPHKH